MSREPIKEIRRIVQAGAGCSPKSYWRAATQRLEVAKFLMKNSTYYLDAVYLAGYAAECSLKSLILEQAPRSKRDAVCEEISSSAKAHNLDFLSGILNRKRPGVPGDVITSLNTIKHEWATSLRYAGAIVPRLEAESFIAHVDSVCQWVERSK